MSFLDTFWDQWPPLPISKTPSASAKAFVQARHKVSGVPTWDDVAAAYDAGMRHGIENRQHARQQLPGIQKR